MLCTEVYVIRTEICALRTGICVDPDSGCTDFSSYDMDFSADHTALSAGITDISGYTSNSVSLISTLPHMTSNPALYTLKWGVGLVGFAEFSSGYPW